MSRGEGERDTGQPMGWDVDDFWASKYSRTLLGFLDFWISRDVVDFRLVHRFAGGGGGGGGFDQRSACKLCCLLLFLASHLWFVVCGLWFGSFLVPEWKFGVVRHYSLDLCVVGRRERKGSSKRILGAVTSATCMCVPHLMCLILSEMRSALGVEMKMRGDVGGLNNIIWCFHFDCIGS